MKNNQRHPQKGRVPCKIWSRNIKQKLWLIVQQISVVTKLNAWVFTHGACGNFGSHYVVSSSVSGTKFWSFLGSYKVQCNNPKTVHSNYFKIWCRGLSTTIHVLPMHLLLVCVCVCVCVCVWYHTIAEE